MANLQLLAQKNKKHIEIEHISQGKPQATKDGLGALLNSSKRYTPQNLSEAINAFEQDGPLPPEEKIVHKPEARVKSKHLPEGEDSLLTTPSLVGTPPLKELSPQEASSLEGTVPTRESTHKGTPAISDCVIKLIEGKFGIDAIRLLGGHDIKFLTLLYSKTQTVPRKFVRISRRELEDAGVKTARITVIREKLSGQFRNKSEKKFFPYEIICFHADKVDEQNRAFTEYKLNI